MARLFYMYNVYLTLRNFMRIEAVPSKNSAAAIAGRVDRDLLVSGAVFRILHNQLPCPACTNSSARRAR